jgi:chromosome condensin MukBEF ATPase and DNA-binding subunit MukB
MSFTKISECLHQLESALANGQTADIRPLQAAMQEHQEAFTNRMLDFEQMVSLSQEAITQRDIARETVTSIASELNTVVTAYLSRKPELLEAVLDSLVSRKVRIVHTQHDHVTVH